MDQVEEREVEISREFDYSNSVPEVQTISFLAQYCDSDAHIPCRLLHQPQDRQRRGSPSFPAP